MKALRTLLSNDQDDPLTVGQYIDLETAAHYCGLSVDTLREYAGNGRLRATKIGNAWATPLLPWYSQQRDDTDRLKPKYATTNHCF